MDKTLSIAERLDAIKALIGISNDAELSRMLGISKQRVYSWRRRDRWDAPTVLAAFPALRESWVERGEGEMSSKEAQLTLKVQTLEQLIAQKDDIIEAQGRHIKHLTEKLSEHL